MKTKEKHHSSRNTKFELIPHSPIVRNILRNPLSEQELLKILVNSPAQPLVPRLGDSAWQDVRARPHLAFTIETILKKVQASLQCQLPKLTDELYTAFHRTGVRLEFDNVYGTRRRLFTQTAIAALLSKDPAPLLPVLYDRWREILSEDSWALSAHVNDSTGRDPRCLDLKACETCNAVAELAQIFSEVIPTDLLELTCERIESYLAVFLEGDFSPWGWFRSKNNWNAVCHQGIVGAALNQETDPARLAAILCRMSHDLPQFLEGFTPDGGCTEGPGYWAYGFGWFCWLNQQLEKRTGGYLSLVQDDPLISKISRFGIHFHVPPDGKINFADCMVYSPIQPGLIAYLGTRLNDTLLSKAADAIYFQESIYSTEPDEDRLDFFTISRNLLFSPAKVSSDIPFPNSDCSYPDLGVWNVRGIDTESGRSWSIAAKAGHNGEHHNHNDCGSYIIHLDGIPIVSELGMPEYVKRYFHGDRYSILASRSLGHSVPLINGCEQRAGQDHAAKILTIETGKVPNFAADIAPCYPESACCTSAIRRIFVQRNSLEIIVTDEITLSECFALETALMTLGETEIDSEMKALLHMREKSLLIQTLNNTRIDRVENYTYHDRVGNTNRCQRLVFTANTPFHKSIALGYRLKLV